MPSLLELQRNFCVATLFGDESALRTLGIVPGALDAKSRLAVYRNNVFGNYRKVLAATFPVLRRLVGAAFFSAAAEHFVRHHPSTRGDVNGYGGEFSLFLASYRPARDLAYLPDVACLEWAVDQSAIAADAPPMDLHALSAVPADVLPELTMQLHPSVRLLTSEFPLLRIWRANQPDDASDGRVDLDAGGDRLLVARGEDGVTIERLSAGEHMLLAMLAAHDTLGTAAARAANADDQFDLTAALRRYVANRTLVAFRAPRGKGAQP